MRNLLVVVALLVSVPALAQRRSRSAESAAAQPLWLGGYAGVMVPLEDGLETMPQLGVSLAGPIRLGGDADALRLEWTGALDVSFFSSSTTFLGTEVESSAFTLGLMPGLRLVVPVHPRLGFHVDVAAGPELSFLRGSLSNNGGSTESSTDELGLVLRGGAGLLLNLNESLRLQLTPLAFQTYVADGSRTYYSATAGLAFALD